MSKITGPDQCDIDLLVQLQNLANLLDQIRNIISDPFPSKITEIRQVLTNLSRIEVQLLSEFLEETVETSRF